MAVAGETKAERREAMESWPSVTWRRWVTGEFRALKKWIKVNLRLNYRALKVQMKELERRLTALNGQHEKEKENRQNFVLSGTYSSDLEGTRSFQQRTEERFTKLELAQSTNPTAGLQNRLERAEERLGKIETSIVPVAGALSRLDRSEERMNKIETLNATNAGQEATIKELSRRVDATTKFMWLLTGAYFLLVFCIMVFGVVWGAFRK